MRLVGLVLLLATRLFGTALATAGCDSAFFNLGFGPSIVVTDAGDFAANASCSDPSQFSLATATASYYTGVIGAMVSVQAIAGTAHASVDDDFILLVTGGTGLGFFTLNAGGQDLSDNTGYFDIEFGDTRRYQDSSGISVQDITGTFIYNVPELAHMHVEAGVGSRPGAIASAGITGLEIDQLVDPGPTESLILNPDASFTISRVPESNAPGTLALILLTALKARRVLESAR